MEKPYILVIDDDPVIRQFIDGVLSNKGFRVVTAETAQNGLEVACAEPPDIMLIDYLMPDKNGLDLIKEMRATPELDVTPIIMITANGSSKIVVQAIALRVSDFLVKPFSIRLLVDRVRKSLPPRFQDWE